MNPLNSRLVPTNVDKNGDNNNGKKNAKNDKNDDTHVSITSDSPSDSDFEFEDMRTKSSMTFDHKKIDENLGNKIDDQPLRQIDDSRNSSSKHNRSYKVFYEDRVQVDGRK